jgi:hypothetical protein
VSRSNFHSCCRTVRGEPISTLDTLLSRCTAGYYPAIFSKVSSYYQEYTQSGNVHVIGNTVRQCSSSTTGMMTVGYLTTSNRYRSRYTVSDNVVSNCTSGSTSIVHILSNAYTERMEYQRNTFVDNIVLGGSPTSAVYLTGSVSASYPTVDFTGSTLDNPRLEYEFYSTMLFLSGEVIQARHSWWGSDDYDVIRNRTQDFRDNPSKRCVLSMCLRSVSYGLCVNGAFREVGRRGGGP